MIRSWKKLLSVLLVFMLVMSMFPAAAFATEDETEVPDEQELLLGGTEENFEEGTEGDLADQGGEEQTGDETLLLSSDAGALLQTLSDSSGGERGIQNFYVHFDLSADPTIAEDGLGNYIWTPTSGEAGHQFKFTLYYVLSGYFSYNANELQFRIPKSILRDASGAPADEYDLSIPHEDDPEVQQANREFVYRVEGDEIVIYNRIGIPAAQNGYIDVGYYTSKPTYEYADYDPDGAEPADRNPMTPDPFFATLTLSPEGGEPETMGDSEGMLFIDTSAQVTGVVKKPLPQGYFENWVSSWGPAPADAADYSYVIWEIKSTVTATQRYDFTLTDEVLGCVAPEGAQIAMELCGYKMQGQSTFTLSGSGSVTLYNQTANYPSGRYDYVLTRHLKSDCAELPEYTIKNQATAAVHPRESGADTTRTSSSTYTYVHPVFHPSFGSLGAGKSGLDFQNSPANTSEQVRNFNLDKYHEQNSDTIDDLAWRAGFSNALYYLTATDPNDPATYATNSVTYELWDNTLSLKAFGTATPYVGLTAENYLIDRVQLSWTMKDATFNEQTQSFDPIQADYTGETLEVFAQFGSDTTAWIKVGEYDMENSLGSLTDEGTARGVLWLGRTIKFPSAATTPEANRCTGYRVVTSNKHYSVDLYAVPHVTLLRSEAVTAVVDEAFDVDNGGQNKIVTANTATANVYAGAYTGEELEAQNPAAVKTGSPTGYCYAIGIIRHGSISKTVRYTPQTVYQRCKLTWTVSAKEWYQDNFGTTVYVPQQSGVFYDVLPLGAIFDGTTLYVTADGEELFEGDYTYTLTENWKGSGCTLLTLTIVEPAQHDYEFNYATYHTWNDLAETGKIKKNLVAYETGNDDIGNGQPDAPASGTFPTQLDMYLMTELDPDTNDNRFIYAWRQYTISALTAGDLGLYKQVKATNDLDYSYSTVANSGEMYSYKIRFATDAITQAKDLILFDSLENFSPYAEDDSDWHGILQSVDTSAMQSLGVAPVVYYSTNPEWRLADPDARWTVDGLEGLEPENGASYDFAAHSDIWTEASVYAGSMADVKAIAVDLRTATNGQPYLMSVRTAASVTVYMRAPESMEGLDPSNPDFKAYNNIYLFNTVKAITEDEFEPSQLIHQAYTQLGYHLIGQLKLVKIDQNVYDTTHELQPVQGIRFRLWGTSAYGIEVDRELTTNAIGEITFGGLELGTYNLQEQDGIPDYQQNHIVMQVTVDEDGNAYIGVPEEDPENPGQYIYNYAVYDGMIIGIRSTDGAYIVGNKPRVHGDLDFIKKGRVDGSSSLNLMPDVTFKITGVSAYGNRFSDEETPSTAIYVTTDTLGVGHIVDLEKSSSQGYTMVETQTINGYILSERVFKLYCDENGVTLLYVDGGDEVAPAAYDPASGDRAPDAFVDGNGNYVIVNDAYHNLYIFKYNVVNAEGLSGAVFSLTGDGYYQEATAAASGVAEFNGLDVGSYTLQEVTAPDGFTLDDTIHIVTVAADGSVELDGRSLDVAVDDYYDIYDNEPEDPTARLAAFPIANDPQTATITIVKYWEGLETGETPPTPTLHLDAERPTITGNFATISRAKWLALVNNGENTSSSLPLRSATAFAHYAGNVEDPDGSGWTRIDDETTAKKVWFKKIDTTLYWYSDAATVYLPEDSGFLFARCASLTEISTAGLNSSRVTSMYALFAECTGLVNEDGTKLYLSNLNTSHVENMKSLFFGCTNLKNLQTIAGWDTGSVTTMYQMFYNCNALAVLDVSEFDTSSVTTMYRMFSRCTSLTSLDLHTHESNGKTRWDVSKVEDMRKLFNHDTALVTINTNGWDTGKVERMDSMFGDCGALQNIWSTGWNTGRVWSMHCMFYGDGNLFFKDAQHPNALDVSGWNTSRLVIAVWLFNKCYKATVLDLSGWNMSQIENAAMMFQECTALTTIYGVGAWTIPEHTNNDTITHTFPDNSQVTFEAFGVVYTGTNTAVTVYSDSLMFFNCEHIRGGAGTAYSNIYNGWNNNPATTGRDSRFARVDGYDSQAGYFTEPAGDRSLSLYPQSATPDMTPLYASAPMSAVSAEPTAAAAADDEPDFLAAVPSMEQNSLLTSGAPGQTRSGETPTGPIANQVSDPDGWTQNADGTWSYTFTVYDFDYTYYLWEGVLPGFNSDTYQPDVVVIHYAQGGGLTAEPDGRVIEYPAGNAPATYAVKVTNTKSTSTSTALTVTKAVTGGGDTTAYFDIMLTLSDTSINGLYGDVGFENGVATLSLRGGQSLTATGLPQGITYTVTEPNPQGHDVTYTNGTGTIGADPITATVTNYKPDLPPPPETGGFSILMTVEDEWISEGHRFSGYVTLYTDEECTAPATDINGLYGSLLFTNGTAPWMLVHGESIAASGLSTDLWYKVTENEEEGWQASYPENRSAQVSVTPPQAVVYNEKVEVQTNGFTVDLVAEDFDGDPAFPVYVSMANLTAGTTYGYVITYANGSTENMTFTALGNGTATITVNLRNGESAAFSELPIDSTYTLSEPSGNFIANYTAVNSGTTGGVVSPAGGNPMPYTALSTATEVVEAGEDILVTFINVNPKITVSGTKLWVDDDNSGNTRPESISIYLMADGRQIRSQEVTEAADGSWSWSFENLDRFTTGSNGLPREIVYTIEEDEVPDYVASVSGYNVTNTLITVPLQIQVTKVWEDNGGADGARPESVQIVLVRNGVDTSSVAELNEGNAWSFTFTGLAPTDPYGDAYVYTVRELVPDGYSAVCVGNMAEGYTITNTRIVSVSGAKTWVDDNNNGNTRPASITVRLFKSVNDSPREQIGVQTVTEANSWSWGWSGLPKYETVNEETYEIVYSVDEDEVAGYTKLVSGYDITNTMDLTTITAVVHWDDANDQDGKRDDVVAKVQLYKTVGTQRDAVGDPVTVGHAEGWSTTWSNLPKYENGTQIVYSVEETLETPNGYVIVDGDTTTVKEIDVDFGGTGEFTNHYDPEQTTATVTKIWVDNDNQDGIRPTSLTVTLSNGTQVTLTAANGWTATVEGLPKYANGVEIVYTWDEGEVEGYTLSTSVNGTTTTLTNTHIPETTTITTVVHWDDDSDRDGKRGDVVARIRLYKTVDGVKTLLDTVTVGSEDDWTKIWSNLPKNEGGLPIAYSVEETLETPNGYVIVNGNTTTVKEINVDFGGTGEFTNRYTPETTDITAIVHWDDANDQDGKRGGVVAAVQLYKTVNGVKTAVGAPVSVGQSQNWSKLWSDLYVYEKVDGVTYAISYSVEETLGTPNGYWIVDGGTTTVKEIVIPNDGTGEFTNRYTPETTDITVVVHWDDANDQDGKRGDVVARIRLYKTVDGVKTLLDTVTVGSEDDWTKVWEDLPKYEDGKLISYSAEETLENPNGYAIVEGDTTTVKEIVIPNDGTGEFTNRYTPETTTITAVVHWDDNNDMYGRRGGVAATVRLYKTVDGVKTPIGDPVEVGHDQDWSKIWENLPKYEGGRQIQYSVEETLTTANGYTIVGAAEIPVDFGGTGEFTNRYRVIVPPTPPMTSVTVSKVWDDDNNASGERPDSVTVVLVRNGADTATRATLSASNNWRYTFANLLAADDAGSAYVYTVREEVPDGYTAEYSGNAVSGFVITNTKDAEIVDPPITLDPDEPTPDVPDEPTPLSPDVPKTGDASRIYLWLALGVAALGGIAVLGRKRKEDEA